MRVRNISSTRRCFSSTKTIPSTSNPSPGAFSRDPFVANVHQEKISLKQLARQAKLSGKDFPQLSTIANTLYELRSRPQNVNGSLGDLVVVLISLSKHQVARKHPSQVKDIFSTSISLLLLQNIDKEKNICKDNSRSDASKLEHDTSKLEAGSELVHDGDGLEKIPPLLKECIPALIADVLSAYAKVGAREESERLLDAVAKYWGQDDRVTALPIYSLCVQF